MKITIDTIRKTISLDEAVNANELNEALNELLGDKLRHYTLYHYTPVYIPYPTPYYPGFAIAYPPAWPTPPWIVTCAANNTASVQPCAVATINLLPQA